MMSSMEMIEQELNRLKARLTELTERIVPDFQNRTELLYGQIMQHPKGSDQREKLEHEYTLLSKELTLRSDEIIRIKSDMENLELEKRNRR